MDGREKFDYWWKIILFAIVGIACLISGIYVATAIPFSFMTIVFSAAAAVGVGFCSWVVTMLAKEYIKKIRE